MQADEGEQLKRRIAELEAELERASRKSQWFEGLIASVPGVIWENWWRQDPHQGQANFTSKYVEAMTGYTAEEWNKDPNIWVKLTHPDDRERAARENQHAAAAGQGHIQSRWITKDGRTIWTETYLTTMRNKAGEPIGLRGVTLDVTARKVAEEEQARLQREMVQMQGILSELTTPLIPLSDTVMVMPLIGAIDRARADKVIATLLNGIGGARAHVAIIDITGVPVVDTEFADALVRAARSVRLLGAEVVLTGIRPEVAQTLVSIGADLTGITTQGSLQGGIAYAMTRG